MHRTSLLFRPFGVAFGIFIVLNAALALQRPQLATTGIWLDVDLPEPQLSLFAAVLGAALFLPHELSSVSWVRSVLGGVFCGFGILELTSTVGFYQALHRDQISTDFPVPLSAFLSAILLLEFVRVFWWKPAASRLPAPARVFVGAISVFAAFLLITLIHIVTYGHVDFRTHADAAVIFGAKVYPDGTPSRALAERLEAGVRLHEQGFVTYLVMTGARDPNGWSEPQVMKDYAQRRGVPPARIILDEEGVNTRASASRCAAIAQEFGLESFLAVTQYFHCARVKLIFEREGLECHTVPTCALSRDLPGESIPLSREGFFLLREAFAFPFYLVYYR